MNTRPHKSAIVLLLGLMLLAASSDVHAAPRWKYATLLVTGTLTFRTSEKTSMASSVQQFPQFYQEVTGQTWSGKADFGDETLSKLLDGIGAAGWELVQVETAQSGARTFYFKRS